MTTESSSITRAPSLSVEGLERVLLSGDLSELSPEQAVAYYARVCESVGLNPLTQPFEYLNLSGRMVLYARRACTDQLRHIHQVSIQIVSRENIEGCYTVTARASMPSGRADESVGAVSIQGLKGESLSNAVMRAETKAKRRVTLSICGLSMLDESELDGVADKARSAGRSAAQHAPEAFPLASQPQNAPQAPAQAAWEPEPTERKPAVVVPFRAAQAPTGAAEAPRPLLERQLADSLTKAFLDLHVPALREARSAEQLVAWMRGVLSTFAKENVPQATKTALWAEWARRCGLLRQDPDALHERAKKQGGAP